MDRMAGVLPYIDLMEDFISNFIAHSVYLAPSILLILEEAGLPLPLSDYILAYTGYQISIGKIPYWHAYLILLIADMIGASILYYLSRRWGHKIIYYFGKYIDLDKEKLQKVEKYFKKYGVLVVIIGRHVVGFKIPATIFAGISKMNYWVFLVSVFISVQPWLLFYLALGEKLGKKTIHLLHTHHFFYIIALFPIFLSVLPFVFMRKSRKSK